MFVEIFEGHVRDEAGLRTQIDRWAKILPSGALGWLGATGGIADDGTALADLEMERHIDLRHAASTNGSLIHRFSF